MESNEPKYATMQMVNELYKEINSFKRKLDFIEDQVLELQGEQDIDG